MHPAGHNAQPNFPTQVRRSSDFSNSISSIPQSRPNRSQSASSSARTTAFAQEGIMATNPGARSQNSRSPAGRPRRHSTNVPTFNEKHLQKLHSKMARRISNTPPPPSQFSSSSNSSNGYGNTNTNTKTTNTTTTTNNNNNNTIINQQITKADNDLGQGWWRLSSAASGDFQRCGLHTMVSAAKHKAQFLCLFKPHSSSSPPSVSTSHYVVQFQIKCVKLPNVERHEASENFCNVVFNLQNTQNYCCLTIEFANGGFWSITQTINGVKKQITKIADLDGVLRQNVFYSVRVDVKNDKVSVTSNNQTIFNGVGIGVVAAPNNAETKTTIGDSGILCRGSRCALKDWTLAHFENGQKKSEASERGEARRASFEEDELTRDGSRDEMVADIMVSSTTELTHSTRNVWLAWIASLRSAQSRMIDIPEIDRDSERLAQAPPPELEGLPADDRKFGLMILSDIVSNVDGIR